MARTITQKTKGKAKERPKDAARRNKRRERASPSFCRLFRDATLYCIVKFVPFCT
jgi:hypothetical protein